MPSDRSPLFPTDAHDSDSESVHSPQTLWEICMSLIKTEGEPSWTQSHRSFILGSWINVLLVFVLLSFIAHYLDFEPSLRFSFSCIAIVPLAKCLGDAIDQLSASSREAIALVLNISLGNPIELIVGVIALLRGEIRVVQTFMLGSMLFNILFIMGCSFLASGLKFREANFLVTSAQASSSLLTLSCITLVVPAAYHSFAPHQGDLNGNEGLLVLSKLTALLLLLVYIMYLFFQLWTHSYLYLVNREEEEEEADGPAGPEGPAMNSLAALSALLLTVIVTAFCADHLVSSLEEAAEQFSISKIFIGVVLLPIVANAAQCVFSVTMALKNRLEVSLGCCVGSAIQIATFLVPLMVIVGWITHHEMTLFFEDFETVTLFVSVLLVNTTIQDGKSNYLEGLMLTVFYVVLAAAFWMM